MAFLFWTLLPSLLFVAANILQKVGLNRVAVQMQGLGALDWIKSVLRNFPWWGGIGIAAIATLGKFEALRRFNISLVEPMLALNPVLTAVAGWWILKERMDRRTLVAILTVLVGVLVSASQMHEAAGSESTSRLLVFVGGWSLAVCAVWVLSSNTEARRAMLSGVGFGLSDLLWKSSEASYQLLGIDVQTLLRALGFVGTYLAGFFFLQMALARGRALFVVPFVSALGLLVPALAGIVVYQEPISNGKILALALVSAGSLLFIRRNQET